MWNAIQSGEVPAIINGSVLSFPMLSYVGARGKTHNWKIQVRIKHNEKYVPIVQSMLDKPTSEMPGYTAVISVESGQEGGKIRDSSNTYVSTGKNIGKSNETNCATQAVRDALGKFNKQKKIAESSLSSSASNKGNLVDEQVDEQADEAKNKTALMSLDNQELRPPPQLVKKIGDSLDANLTAQTFLDGVTLQRKLNGVRYIALSYHGVIKGYSRTARDYAVQPNIEVDLKLLFSHLPSILPGTYGVPEASSKTVIDGLKHPYFDGEIYQHGAALEQISGQIRKKTSTKSDLKYYIFDVFFPYAMACGFDMSSRHRQQYLDACFRAVTSTSTTLSSTSSTSTTLSSTSTTLSSLVRVENYTVHSMEEIEEYEAQFLEEGFEGAIARKDTAGYRYSAANYHSSNVLKIKPILDAEFEVVDYTQGTIGKDVGAIVWICKVSNPVIIGDDEFHVVPKNMSLDDRKKLYACMSTKEGDEFMFNKYFKGKMLTVVYPEISKKTNKPLRAKSTVFRTYEADHDPIQAVMDKCLAD
jgi:ATP-dependent DNA ligase